MGPSAGFDDVDVHGVGGGRARTLDAHGLAEPDADGVRPQGDGGEAAPRRHQGEQGHRTTNSADFVRARPS